MTEEVSSFSIFKRRGSSRAEAADDDDVVNHFIAAGFWSRNWLLTKALATSHESARCWYYRHYMIRGLEHYHIPYTLRLRLSYKVLVLDSNHEDVLIPNYSKFVCFGLRLAARVNPDGRTTGPSRPW